MVEPDMYPIHLFYSFAFENMRLRRQLAEVHPVVCGMCAFSTFGKEISSRKAWRIRGGISWIVCQPGINT